MSPIQAETATMPAGGLILSGECAGSCLVASTEPAGCTCTCGGRYHGALVDAMVAEVHGDWVEPWLRDHRCGGCSCRLRRWLGTYLYGDADGGMFLCQSCVTSTTQGSRVHYSRYPDCPDRWHDVWDHGMIVAFGADRSVNDRFLRSAYKTADTCPNCYEQGDEDAPFVTVLPYRRDVQGKGWYECPSGHRWTCFYMMDVMSGETLCGREFEYEMPPLRSNAIPTGRNSAPLFLNLGTR